MVVYTEMWGSKLEIADRLGAEELAAQEARDPNIAEGRAEVREALLTRVNQGE